jgi:surface protein
MWSQKNRIRNHPQKEGGGQIRKTVATGQTLTWLWLSYRIRDMETPNTKVDLRELVVREIARQGFAADLNHINTSRVNDFNDLFYGTGFEGDVSRWDTSNVRSMNGTFSFTKFNGDVSRWDVSKVKDMTAMFGESWFNGDVARWDVTNVQFFTQMFAGSRFNSELFKIRDVDTRFISGMLEGAPFEKCLKSCGHRRTWACKTGAWGVLWALQRHPGRGGNKTAAWGCFKEW